MPDRDVVIKDGERAIAILGEVEEPTPWCEFIRVSFENALALLREREPVGVWISVKDRLPEKPGRYLCWFGKNTFTVGASIVPYIPDLHWFASLESLERYENVTHWMPLPESPEVTE